MTKWDGELRFQGSHAHYRGRVGDHTEHAHLALQLVIPANSAAVWSGGERVQAHADAALLIGSLVPHRLECEGPLQLVFIDPAGGLGRRLRRRDEVGIVPVQAEVAAEIMATHGASKDDAGMSFIACAMASLEADPTLRLADLAYRFGSPPSTFRRQARARLGSSLASWRLWSKLDRSCRALAGGSTLAEAANAGGFSDQAHFTRTMRRVFGVSPAQVSGPLRAGQPR